MEVRATLKDDSGDTIGSSANPLHITNATLAVLGNDAHHETKIWPTLVNLVATMTASTAANLFSDWATLGDLSGNDFSTCFTSAPGYIASVVIEDASVKDKVYMFEIGYGSATNPTTVARSRVVAGDNQVGNTSQDCMRTQQITQGATVYYRLACETQDSTLDYHIRYYNS
jgi:hypothetical protein